ncbi:hypothetical protein AAMO2058_000306700 [Amorphochlora amoebiformis]
MYMSHYRHSVRSILLFEAFATDFTEIWMPQMRLSTAHKHYFETTHGPETHQNKVEKNSRVLWPNMPHSISLGRITVGAHDPSPTNSRTRAESETRVGTRAGTQQHMNSTNSVSFDHQRPGDGKMRGFKGIRRKPTKRGVKKPKSTTKRDDSRILISKECWIRILAFVGEIQSIMRISTVCWATTQAVIDQRLWKELYAMYTKGKHTRSKSWKAATISLWAERRRTLRESFWNRYRKAMKRSIRPSLMESYVALKPEYTIKCAQITEGGLGRKSSVQSKLQFAANTNPIPHTNWIHECSSSTKLELSNIPFDTKNTNLILTVTSPVLERSCVLLQKVFSRRDFTLLSTPTVKNRPNTLRLYQLHTTVKNTSETSNSFQPSQTATLLAGVFEDTDRKTRRDMNTISFLIINLPHSTVISSRVWVI